MKIRARKIREGANYSSKYGIADVTDKWSLTSNAFYVLLLLLFLTLSTFLFNRLVADAPVDYDKYA